MGVAPRCTHRLRQQEAAFERAEEGARWQEGAEPRDWRAGRGAAGGVGVRVGVWGPHGDGGTDKAWPRSLCPRTREGSGNPGCAEGEKRQASSAVGCIPSPPRPRPASPLAPSSSPSLLPLFRPPSSSSFRTPLSRLLGPALVRIRRCAGLGPPQTPHIFLSPLSWRFETFLPPLNTRRSSHPSLLA